MFYGYVGNRLAYSVFPAIQPIHYFENDALDVNHEEKNFDLFGNYAGFGHRLQKRKNEQRQQRSL